MIKPICFHFGVAPSDGDGGRAFCWFIFL